MSLVVVIWLLTTIERFMVRDDCDIATVYDWLIEMIDDVATESINQAINHKNINRIWIWNESFH